MKTDVNMIKELREETGAGVMDVKKVLEEVGGDKTKALEILKKKAAEKAEKKSDRETKDGLIEVYIHGAGKVAGMINLACETDFVAKTDDFKKLAKEIAMQVCGGDHESVEELLEDEYMRDSSKTIKDLIVETIGKVGENIEIRDFVKMSVR